MIPSESAFCQVQGSALRMEAKRFLAHVEQIETLRTMLLRYSYATIVMTSQIAACNRAHKVEARLARWLLMTQDRADGPEFPLTQDLLSQMLGVHRQAVSVAGATLQNAGLIKYTRGKITVVDRKGLEDASCSCYGRIRAELAQVFRGYGE